MHFYLVVKKIHSRFHNFINIKSVKIHLHLTNTTLAILSY